MKRVLVANRGEIAVRVIRALHELGLEAVAVYSTADASSLHVTLADAAVCIGPHLARDSYLNQSAVISAAQSFGCQAIHPGYGFLAENAGFAKLCAEQDVLFIGPSPQVIARMGDKITAKQAMQEAGVPVLPGSQGAIEDARAAREFADSIGYPVLLKATAGGGGKGMRLCRRAPEMESAFELASAEAQANFGEATLYMEKALANPRHIEVQVLGDTDGNVLTLAERDCSLQRRHQKVVEESPSPGLSPGVRTALMEASQQAARALSYHTVGTLEYLLDSDGSFYFMEMNTRLQVEHPISEEVSGLDIVREQITLAQGRPLTRTGALPPQGHALEFRLCAEDAARGFAPGGGTVDTLRIPSGPGVRFDSFLYEGYTVPPFYDSLLAKLIIWDATRDLALMRSKRALEELVLEGIVTTLPLHKALLEDSGFRSGTYNTHYLEDCIEALLEKQLDVAV